MTKLLKQSAGFSVVETLLVVIILGIIGFVGWYVVHAKHTADKNLNSSASTASQTGVAGKKATTTKTVAPAGTDNASLDSSANDASSSITKSDSNTAGTNAALNDQQNQISVPTN